MPCRSQNVAISSGAPPSVGVAVRRHAMNPSASIACPSLRCTLNSADGSLIELPSVISPVFPVDDGHLKDMKFAIAPERGVPSSQARSSAACRPIEGAPPPLTP
jgi:hypothetical protein